MGTLDKYLAYRSEYIAMWHSLRLTTKEAAARAYAQKVLDNRKRYQRVAAQTSTPWYLVGVLHVLESDADFNTHLHNGDPLGAKTVRVPANRPHGEWPPDDVADLWVSSAIDAVGDIADIDVGFSVSKFAFACERFNGFGYRARGIASPYLWSGSQHYTTGKYVADGVFDADAVSGQVGTMVIIRYVIDLVEGT